MDIDRFDDAVCAVCARSAIGIGHAPQSRMQSPIMWVCDDPQCLQDVIASYTMKQDAFNAREEWAKRNGGAEGAAYLETIGKSDIFQMSEPEWNEFLRRIVAGYRKGLKQAMHSEAPF